VPRIGSSGVPLNLPELRCEERRWNPNGPRPWFEPSSLSATSAADEQLSVSELLLEPTSVVNASSACSASNVFTEPGVDNGATTLLASRHVLLAEVATQFTSARLDAMALAVLAKLGIS